MLDKVIVVPDPTKPLVEIPASLAPSSYPQIVMFVPIPVAAVVFPSATGVDAF